jgi:hypothetical protein
VSVSGWPFSRPIMEPVWTDVLKHLTVSLLWHDTSDPVVADDTRVVWFEVTT